MRSILKIGLCAFWLTASTLSNAAELGRLFFTPEQRTQLEYKPTSNSAEDGSSSAWVINGIVQKKGGARTVWINGIAQPAGKSDESAPDSLSVTVPGEVQPVKAKVGQKILLDQPELPSKDELNP